MSTLLIRRVFPLLALAALTGYFVSHLPALIPGSDLFFHLRMGDEFRDGWSISSPGHLGPFDSADWVPTQWLPQIVMSWITEHWGLTAVVWIAGAFILLLAGLVFLTCRALSSPLPAALATGLALIVTAPGLSARPQVISYVLVAVVTAAWLATSRDHKPRYWLIPLSWLWAMCHGMWPVGLLIGLVTLAGMVAQRDVPRAVILKLLGILAASAVVVCLTPVGWRVYAGVVTVGSRSSYFAEWAAPDFTDPATWPLLAMFAVVGLAAMTAVRLSWPELFVFGLAVVWALYSNRTTPVAAIMLAPMVAATLQRFVPVTPAPGRLEKASIVAVLAACGLVMIPAARDVAHKPVVPAWLDARLSDLPDDSRILNEWDDGAYFVWRHPDLSWAMHGYGDVFTDAELERNAAIVRVEPEWDEMVRDLEVDVAVVASDSTLAYALERDGWSEVEGDEEFLLLTPPSDY